MMTIKERFEKWWQTEYSGYAEGFGAEDAYIAGFKAAEAQFTMQKIVHNEYLDIHQTIYIKEE
jgi:hypothetical protein